MDWPVRLHYSKVCADIVEHWWQNKPDEYPPVEWFAEHGFFQMPDGIWRAWGNGPCVQITGLLSSPQPAIPNT